MSWLLFGTECIFACLFCSRQKHCYMSSVFGILHKNLFIRKPARTRCCPDASIFLFLSLVRPPRHNGRLLSLVAMTVSAAGAVASLVDSGAGPGRPLSAAVAAPAGPPWRC